MKSGVLGEEGSDSVEGVVKLSTSKSALFARTNTCNQQQGEMGEVLETAGISWTIRHIYREYNQAADTLSNEAIDLPEQWWATEGW